MDDTLGDDIANYIRDAEALDKDRKDRVERLEKEMKEEIIPAVEQLLPEHYSISAKGNYVDMGGDDSGSVQSPFVPTTFHLVLRVLYKKKPIVLDSRGERKLEGIQGELESQLEKIAKPYHIESILFSV